MDDLLLNYAAKKGAQLLKDVRDKHENGEFLLELTAQNPHLYKNVQYVLITYCELISELGFILAEKDKKIKMSSWIKKLRKTQTLEKKLFFDCFNIELGGNH